MPKMPLTERAAGEAAHERPSPTEADNRDHAGLVRLCLIAVVGGILIGFIGGAFRWALEHATTWRVGLVAWVGDAPGPAWLAPILVTAAGAGIARWLVTFSPNAAGSGVQEVEGVWSEELPPPKLRVLPIKFVGGLLAIGSGMVLGREGPTVQMGSTIGAEASRRLGISGLDAKILQVALGGAGLAVAFNAPIGGAIFVFEEVTKSFRPKLVMTTLIGCAVAVGCSRIIMGDRPDFVVEPPLAPPVTHLWIYVLFGLALGLLGAAYNKLVLGGLRIADGMTAIHPVLRAAMIGAVVGAVLLVDPLAVGGGDDLTQNLLGGERMAWTAVLGYLLVRSLTGPLSYAAGTPGGLFAPLLAVGALWGAAATPIVADLVPSFSLQGSPLMIVGMAAFFAGIVRAPLTGIVLAMEMTAAPALAVPLLAAGCAATLSATLVGSPPIYDSLKARSIRALQGM